MVNGDISRVLVIKMAQNSLPNNVLLKNVKMLNVFCDGSKFRGIGWCRGKIYSLYIKKNIRLLMQC